MAEPDAVDAQTPAKDNASSSSRTRKTARKISPKKSSGKSAKLTPMMERYLEVKRENPGSLLLFRMGDFYELFYDDAEVAAKTLGLTLTSRDKGSDNPIAMAGFPYHSLENYLQKLIRAGFRAAICEQVEDPRQAKGLVKREVTRIVTPGTLTDDNLLDPLEHNFLAAVCPRGDVVGLAWLELSTGRFRAATLEPQTVIDELARIRPAECLIAEDNNDAQVLLEIAESDGTLITPRPPWSFAHEDCKSLLLKHFAVATLDGFSIDESQPEIAAAGALLEYVRETQKSSLDHIATIEPYRHGSSLMLDEATRRSLELTRTLRDNARDGSLISVMDHTVTSMGARRLADWLSDPLTRRTAIDARLDTVEELTREHSLCDELREQLKATYDLERLTSRIATRRANPRDLAALNRTLGLLPKLKARLTGRQSELLCELESQIDLCAEIRADIEQHLVEEPPLLVSDGNIIREGCHAELDELRELARGGKAWIASYQASEIERTGIPNLKIGFNKVFGYYLEVTAAHADKVPEEYVRKQTLKNQERYITPELKEYEDKVLRAEEKSIRLEQELFEGLRSRVAEACRRFQETADALAQIDVITSLSVLAVKGGYCRPEMCDTPVLDIREGRHPVLDRLKPSGEFVPNDVRLGSEEPAEQMTSEQRDLSIGRIQIITGPNMAGKSTYIRQAALITLMAQTGSFVPAAEARIGIADRIFARVGASDELSRGQSTFMVEMTETARILNASTEKSLVILDEIGRGTSTYDGISLAWAVTEYLHDAIKARTLFATHYHELTELTQTLSHAVNCNVAVKDDAGHVIFLHKIVDGPADKSYGIHVAKLAGVPADVIDRANVILSHLEEDHLDETGKPTVPARTSPHGDTRQLSLFDPADHPVLDEIRGLDINQMTPLDALQRLQRIREDLGEK